MTKKKLKKKKAKRRAAGKAAGRYRLGTWLNILPHDIWQEVEPGTNLLKALQEANIDIESDCGGLGKCGKCKVRILTSTELPSGEESREHLDEEEIRQGIRLACQVTIRKDLAVYVGESEPELDYFQILKIGTVPLLDFDPLLRYREIELPMAHQQDGRSNMELVREGLGDEYHRLKAEMSALQSLSGRMQKGQGRGTAVVHRNSLLAWYPGKSMKGFGLIFDLGTSTLVGKLISLEDGQQVAAVSCLNSQNRYGADVISRLQHIATHEDGLARLHFLLIRDLNSLIKRLLKIHNLRTEDVLVAVVAGNTTMQHLLMRLDPSGIAQAPFSPVYNDGLVTRAAEAGLNLYHEALLYVMPIKSGYIGGDLISVILASQAAEQEEKVILGLDLGTNGEIFLGNRRRILTCSAAAGPALEGAKISHGSIARSGAIEGVRFQDGILHFKDIGNIKPITICGSGLVDLVAVLANCGIIDQDGLIRRSEREGVEELNSRVIKQQGVNDFLVASSAETYHGAPIYLMQKDVRELQYAKAAIAAGIQILCSEWGVEPGNIDQIYLAGALGNYVNTYSAMRIGLIPRVEPQRVASLGNAASTGAAMALLSRAYWDMANSLTRDIEHVELSCRGDFFDHFITNMDFPEAYEWERRQHAMEEADMLEQQRYG